MVVAFSVLNKVKRILLVMFGKVHLCVVGGMICPMGEPLYLMPG